ncbi:putative casein kinase [Rhypophila sp. PSN 637]
MTGRGAPGANSRGRGGKFRKFTRGGGKHFSRDLRPLDADGNEISMWSADARNKKNADDSDEEEDSSEESSEEEESDDDAGPSNAALTEAQNREERKNQKKARKEAAIAKAKAQSVQVGDLPPSDSEEESEDDMPANPNRSAASRNQAKAAPVSSVTEAVSKLSVNAPASRREREAADAAAAKERYRKLHEAGKTDEAKADLARLRLIREKREAESARKQAEKEEREAIEAEKKAQIEAKEAKKREAAMGPKAKKGKK